MKGEKGKKVLGISAIRDINSGAVVFNSSSGYEKARKRKAARRASENLINKQEKEIADLNKKMDRILNIMENGANYGSRNSTKAAKKTSTNS